VILLFFAVIGALTVACSVIVGLSFLLASLRPDEPAVRQRAPELVPLVPAVVRRRKDAWPN
jgi:hypothetical protein